MLDIVSPVKSCLIIEFICCQGQLMHIHNTLDSIKRRSAQRSQQQQMEQGQLYTAETDTISLRAKVNARCELHAYDHMLRTAVLTITYIAVAKVLLVCAVYLDLGLGSSELDTGQTRCGNRNCFVMMYAVWPAKWSSLQPSRVRGAGQAQVTLLLYR